MLAVIGEMFEEPSVVGIGMAVRSREDLLSVWNEDNSNDKVAPWLNSYTAATEGSPYLHDGLRPERVGCCPLFTPSELHFSVRHFESWLSRTVRSILCVTSVGIHGTEGRQVSCLGLSERKQGKTKMPRNTWQTTFAFLRSVRSVLVLG